LKQFVAGKLPATQAFNMPGKPVKMFKADLEAAGIAYVDDAGRFADFHSLRHSFGTLLAAAGVHPKTAQTLMRHSDINLTMSRYTHIFRGQESEAIESLPDLSLPSEQAQEQTKTGTDNDAVYMARSMALSGTKQENDAHYGAQKSDDDGKTQNAVKPILDRQKPHLSQNNGDIKPKPTIGFEPITSGLQNRSSTVELRWRKFYIGRIILKMS